MEISYEKVSPYEAFPAIIECIILERFRQGGIVYHSNFIPSH